MVRKLHMLGPLNCLRDLLKDSTEFATFLGLDTPDETTQLAAVVYGYANDLTAKAVIALADLETNSSTTSNFDTVPNLLLRLERETPADEDGTTESEQYISFLGDCECVLDGLREDTAGQLDKLNISGIALGNPPQIMDPENNTGTDRNVWRCDFIIQVNA